MPLYLIRHGETDHNRDKIVQSPNSPLSALGQQQAQQLAKRFSALKVSHILCSDYLRAQQTAQAMLQHSNCEITYNELFRERNFGDIRGKSYDEIGHDFHGTDYLPVNGESYAQFTQRTSLAWQFVQQHCDLYQDNIVVVSHGLVLRDWLKNQLETPTTTQLEQANFANTSVIEVDIKDRKTIITLCDVSHLADNELVKGGVA
jgi:broad specificity phosphatase PhoE